MKHQKLGPFDKLMILTAIALAVTLATLVASRSRMTEGNPGTLITHHQLSHQESLPQINTQMESLAEEIAASDYTSVSVPHSQQTVLTSASASSPAAPKVESVSVHKTQTTKNTPDVTPPNSLKTIYKVRI